MWYEPQLNFEFACRSSQDKNPFEAWCSRTRAVAPNTSVMVSAHGSLWIRKKAFARALAGELGFPLLVPTLPECRGLVRRRYLDPGSGSCASVSTALFR